MRFVIISFVIGTSLLGALLSFALLQLVTAMIFLLLQKRDKKKESILLKKHLHNFNIMLPNNYFEPWCSVSVHDPNKLSWISMTSGSGIQISNSLNFHDYNNINAVWYKKFQTSPHGNGWDSRMHSCTTGIMPGICDNALKPRNNLI